jgi:hypothetical protein
MYHTATDVNVGEAMNRLKIHCGQVPGLFRQFPEEELLYKTAPGKWSRKEILGHLIDSGINNLKRFTEIQFLPQPYKVIPYRQNELVAINQYQNLPLEHLLNTWKALNQQIIFVVNAIPEEKLNYVLEPYDSKEMKSLAWIICDYVAHMEHHFKQL